MVTAAGGTGARARWRIDWDRYEVYRPAGGRLAASVPLVEEDTMVEAHVPYLEWLRAAAGGLDQALDWLLARLDELPLSPKDKADLYAIAGAARALGHRRFASRAHCHWPRRPRRIFYHDGPLIRRREVSLEHELAEPAARRSSRSTSKAARPS